MASDVTTSEEVVEQAADVAVETSEEVVQNVEETPVEEKPKKAKKSSKKSKTEETTINTANIARNFNILNSKYLIGLTRLASKGVKPSTIYKLLNILENPNKRTLKLPKSKLKIKNN